MYHSFTIDDLLASGSPAPAKTISFKPTIAIKPQRWLTPHPDDISKILQIGKLLISDHHWCKGHMAADVYNTPVSEMGDTAFQYCAVGAIRRANQFLPAPRFFTKQWRQFREQKAITAFYKAIDLPGWSNRDLFVSRQIAVMVFNDQSNYGEVLAAFNRAIVIAPYSEFI